MNMRRARLPESTGSTRAGAPRDIMKSMSWPDRIVVDPGVLAGKPVIRGARLAVGFILDLLAAGQPEDGILSNYPGLRAMTRWHAWLALRAATSDRLAGLSPTLMDWSLLQISHRPDTTIPATGGTDHSSVRQSSSPLLWCANQSGGSGTRYRPCRLALRLHRHQILRRWRQDPKIREFEPHNVPEFLAVRNKPFRRIVN
jgi:uncharacterized protein (DUF433 family)